MFAKVFLLLAILLIGSTVALELSAATFDSEVVNSDEAWLVEFYSPMCGSCSEFSPSWDKIEKNFKSSLSIGKVNIDKKENMKLAEDLGVLDEGLPNVRLFNKKGQSKGTSIPVDDTISLQYKNVLNAVKIELQGIKADASGVYKKH